MPSPKLAAIKLVEGYVELYNNVRLDMSGPVATRSTEKSARS
jgi:hypothetical protein